MRLTDRFWPFREVREGQLLARRRGTLGEGLLSWKSPRLLVLGAGGAEADSEDRDAPRPLPVKHPPDDALEAVSASQVVPDVEVVMSHLDEHGGSLLNAQAYPPKSCECLNAR